MASINTNSKIAVIGVGGVGGYLGGVLSKGGLDVTFVARPDSARVLRSEGLIVETVDDRIILPAVKALDSTASLKGVDVVLVTTKSYDLDDVAKSLSDDVKRNSVIVTFQNGIDSDQIVAASAPNSTVFPGIAYIVSKKIGSGQIQQTAGPRKFLIGGRSDADGAAVESVALVMRSAGVDIEVSPNIESALWTKFVWILAFAGVTGACRSTIGSVVNDPGGFRMFERSVDESIAVARALGVSIGDIEKGKILDKAVGYKTVGSQAKASLAVDLDDNRKTEVEALHGTLLRLASEVGIEVPTNEVLYNSIRFSGK